ncbi:hypothetical protein HHL16_23585 [Pseudoflavitalea sp. G-6-1-2]|uniref:hypothetical protein n=1 Tax=Pseudoflavitalea sp. G-6-1-2 TaxID=2728841 RepID=UPI00146F8A39|nr:hypothetical protein [Pseudoflavitalea sp. G-6-1-2]NML23883.1 hypothetical protein [Pseudoflavitalea sp. G-6-1-2]
MPDDFQYTLENICDCNPQISNDASQTFKLGFIRDYQSTEYSLQNLLDATSYFVNTNSGGTPSWAKYPNPLPYRAEYWGPSCYAVQRIYKGSTTEMYYGTKDLQSDEYSFNVMGYSGKFYFTDPFNITVVSDKHFKVSRLTFQDIPDELWKPISGPNAGATCNHWMMEYSPWKAYNKYPQALRGFMLVAEDNTTFTFGNDEYWKDAVEYSISEASAPGQAVTGRQAEQDYWVANSWYLSSIRFPDGRVIDYEYQRGENIRTLFTSEFYFGIKQNNPGCLAADASYTVNSNTTSSKITSPVYLKRISGELLEANFSWSNTDEENALNHDAGAAFRWKKLDEISVKDYQGQQYKWRFSYYPLSKWSQRLFLQSAEKLTWNNISVGEKYSMLYDSALTLPNYNANQNDHWGFWNGVPSGTAVGYTNEQLDVKRSAVLANTRAGILKRLTFPTGGYNEFIFEQNTYGKRVKLQRDQGVELTGTNKNAGGLRIRSVLAYEPTADKSTTTEYFYVDGYTPTLTPAQIAQLPSSGVLNQYSYIYQWDQITTNMYTYPTCTQNVKINITSNQPMNPAMDDAHLGYSTVIEKYGDGSYKKMVFTNHDNGHPDDPPLGGINTFQSPYNKFSSRSIERGKLQSEEIYSNTNKLLSSTETEYTAIPMYGSTDQKSYIPRFTLNLLDATAQASGTVPYTVIPVSYILSNQFKEYTYFYKPAKVVTKIFDQATNNYLLNTQTIQYSQYWPSVITQTNSEGKVVKQINKYSWDIGGNTFMMSRLSNDYPATVVEKINTIKENSTAEEMITSAFLDEYYKNPNSDYAKPLIERKYSLALTNPVPLASLSPSVANDLPFWTPGPWQKDNRYVKEIELPKYDKYFNPVVTYSRDGLINNIIKGYRDLRVIAGINMNGTASDLLAVTSFEHQDIINVTEGIGETQRIPDADQWILEGSLISTEAFTGAVSFSGRVRCKNSFRDGTLYVTARSNGAAPSLEKYDAATFSYLPSNISPIIVSEYAGWKKYQFDISTTQSFIWAVNSNGNIMDDVIAGPRYVAPHYYTMYGYKDGLLTHITDGKLRRTFYEYDAIGRLKLIRDKDSNVVKVFDYQFQAPGHGNAIWNSTNVKRCKPCSLNPTYITAIEQRKDIDVNPQSSTYQQVRWVDIGANSSCADISAWQNTATPLRCRRIYGNKNTGEQEQEQIDVNPCSSTYNQLRWIVVGVNPAACPCNYCTGPDQKCIDGVCSEGVKVYTGTFGYDPRTHMYNCYYVYQFGDGSVSAVQSEWQYQICSIE